MSLSFIKKFVALSALMIGVACFTGGCQTTSGGSTGTTGGVATPSPVLSEKLQVRDTIRVILSGIPKPPEPHEEVIRDDGTIVLPLVGRYEAVGKTVAQVQDELKKEYDKFYRGHVVTVVSDTRYFYVMGEVRFPGKLNYTPDMTFVRAISAAGGYSTFASKSKIQVTRADKSTRFVNGKRVERDPSKDFPIMPGDLINVPKR